MQQCVTCHARAFFFSTLLAFANAKYPNVGPEKNRCVPDASDGTWIINNLLFILLFVQQVAAHGLAFAYWLLRITTDKKRVDMRFKEE